MAAKYHKLAQIANQNDLTGPKGHKTLKPTIHPRCKSVDKKAGSPSSPKHYLK